MDDLHQSRLQLSLPVPFCTTLSQTTTQYLPQPMKAQPLPSKFQTQINRIDIVLPDRINEKSEAKGKNAFKKMGARHLKSALKSTITSNKHKTMDPNMSLDTRINQSYSKMLKAKRGSIQLNKTSREQSSNKQLKNMDSCMSTGITSREAVIVIEPHFCQMKLKKQKFQTEQLFREVNRKLQKQDQKTAFKKKQKKCFYSKLKARLQKQIIKIQQKRQITQTSNMKILIDGCSMQSQLRVGNGWTDRSSRSCTPRTLRGLSKTGLEINMANTQRYPRPKSCRNRSLQRRQFQYAKIHNLHNKNSQRAKSARSRAGNSSKKQNTNPYTSRQSNLTYSHLNSARSHQQRSKSSLVHYKSQQKMLNILLQCQTERLGSQQLHKGMRVFDFYSKKMSESIQRARGKLEGCINQQVSFD